MGIKIIYWIVLIINTMASMKYLTFGKMLPE